MDQRIARALGAFALIALATTACGATQASPSPATPTASPPPSAEMSGPASPRSSGGAIQVKLQEWAVLPSPATAPTGDLTFEVTNTGPEDVHEFVILETDLDPGALPTAPTGAVQEAASGIAAIEEIEDIPVGETQTVTTKLRAGKYVLLCNIYDDKEKEAHYQKGMRIAFEVTGG
jgi:hypothetical protein